MIENLDTAKSSQRILVLEQINQLDQYLCSIGIGQKGELIRYLLDNSDMLNDGNFIRNIGIVLQHQNNSRFNKITERLRCTTIEQYCKCILTASDLESFCSTYLSASKDEKSLEYSRDESAVVILEPKDYLIHNRKTEGSGAGRWYLLSNGTEVFIKNIHSMREAYAELVAEQIAKQMGIPHAQYDLVNIGGKAKIASISILEEAEELLAASDVLQVLTVKDISSLCHSFCLFIKRKYPSLTEEDIQNIKEGFLKITIFDKVIANWDRNPGNWGVIVSPDGNVKISSTFDHNKALDLRSYYEDRNYYRDMSLNGSHGLDILLDYCFNSFSDSDKFLDFIESCIENIDVRKACQDIQKEKGITIPNEEVINMDGVVCSRGTQQMRFWLKRKKSVPGEDEKTK